MKKYTIGIDIGGTNTDAVLVCQREIVFAVKKNTTRPIDRGFFDVLHALLEETKVPLEQIDRICIGSTHAMNAILECSDLYRVGLVRIAGHRPTTISPCALWPKVAQGFSSLERVAKALGIEAPLYMVQNNGSLMELEEALAYPLRTLAAGPTNSFLGAAQLANVQDAIVVDIGGTSTDIGLVRKGFAKRSFRGSTIGGVTLNFPMPDVISIALGGGSYVNNEQIGPKSCGRRLKEEALAFGGTHCTLTDLALSLFPSLIPDANCPLLPISRKKAEEMMTRALNSIQNACKKMANREIELPVILVGGGARLFAEMLPAGCIVPPHAEVANAYGAALAQVSAVEEQVISLNQREKVLLEIIAACKQKVIDKGADASSVSLIDLGTCHCDSFRHFELILQLRRTRRRGKMSDSSAASRRQCLKRSGFERN
ncbi:MAG: hypothetical protein HYX67_04550 [Candidatus Melainabacteria bacterium]|nr:hypothetical protein [Candidatus Melainabacteria bacterium]